MLEALLDLRGHLAFDALLITSRATPLSPDVAVYNYGMTVEHVNHGLEYFIPQSPEFHTVTTRPDEIIDWEAMPSFRETVTAKEHLQTAGFTQGVSLVLRHGARAIGSIHLNVRGPQSFHDTELHALDAARGEIERAVAASVASSDMRLSRREHEVLALISVGCTNPMISESLFISRSTVATHVERILAKLGASNRAQAIRIASEAGLLTL